MSTMDDLIGAAKLGGRLDLLVELKAWIEQKIKAADEENERRRKGIHSEHDIRTTSDAAN